MKTLERQLSEYGDARATGREPTSAESIMRNAEEAPRTRTAATTNRLVVIVATAVVAAVAAATVFVALESGPDPTDPSDNPTTTVYEPTTTTQTGTSALEGDAIPVRWHRATGSVPYLTVTGIAPIVSNGTSYLGVQFSDLNHIDVLVRSPNGINWVEVESPTTWGLNETATPLAVGDVYAWFDDFAYERCPMDADTSCTLITSSDGITWESGPEMPRLYRLKDVIWRVESLETVVESLPPDMDLLDAYETTVIEFEEQLLLLGLSHERGHTFVAQTLTDGGAWSDVAALPPFAATLTTEYMEFGWQWMWRCEFTASEGQAMALIHGGDRYALWTSRDGTNWTTLPAPPQIIDGRHMCIKATSNGWLLAPAPHTGGQDFETIETIGATLDMVRFSSDGVTWHPLEYPQSLADATGVVEAVGNRIFLLNRETGEMIVGVIGG